MRHVHEVQFERARTAYVEGGEVPGHRHELGPAEREERHGSHTDVLGSTSVEYGHWHEWTSNDGWTGEAQAVKLGRRTEAGS